MSKLAHSDTDMMLALDIRRMIDDGDLIMTPVESSNLKRIGYWADKQILVIDYPAACYLYEGFPPGQHRQLMEAKSKGAFVARSVKDLYPCIKLPPAMPGELEPVNSLAATS